MHTHLKTICKDEKPLKQLVHRMQELELNAISEIPIRAAKWYVLKTEHCTGPTLQHCFGIQYLPVFVGKRFLSCKKNDMANCCVLLKDGHVAIIENFVEMQSNPFFIGRLYQDQPDLFISSISSSRLDIFKI